MRNFIEWRQPGLYDVDQASLASALDQTGEESATQQHLGPETDINLIVRRYGLTGELPVRRELGAYGEFDETMDFQTMLHNIKAGVDMFRSIPADLRGRFNNDPGVFLEWIHDDENYDEAAELGLVPVREPVGGVQAAARATGDAGAGPAGGAAAPAPGGASGGAGAAPGGSSASPAAAAAT